MKPAIIFALLIFGFFIASNGWNTWSTGGATWGSHSIQPAFVGSVLHPASFIAPSVWVTRPYYPAWYGYRTWRW